MKDQLILRLEKIAFKMTIPFCYSCYKEAPTGRCVSCGSDDLMRLLQGIGCEYGVDWVIREIVKSIESVDTDERFENSLRDCYPETTQIGWIKYDTVSALKELDPVSWDLAKSEWIDSEESEDILMSFDYGNTFHDTSDVEKYCEEKECELGIAAEDSFAV
jgi:hypothetical protein